MQANKTHLDVNVFMSRQSESTLIQCIIAGKLASVKDQLIPFEFRL